MVGASPCFWIVNSAPSGPVVISPAVIFQSSKAESPLVKSEVKEERANPSLGGHVSGGLVRDEADKIIREHTLKRVALRPSLCRGQGQHRGQCSRSEFEIGRHDDGGGY